MDESAISWTQDENGRPGSTWNPTKGCKVCSPGCKNCYAMAIAGRFSGPGQPFEGLVTIGKNKKAVWNGSGHLDTKALHKPLHWKRPRPIFVDSMSDLFFEAVEDDEIAATYGVMAVARQHRYMILTKRARRKRQWHERIALHGRALRRCGDAADRAGVPVYAERRGGRTLWNDAETKWPLPHVWEGVSVDTRKHGLPRIDELRETDVAVRFLSIEPLLEDLGKLDLRGIHWVIVGCESGKGWRDCRPEWLRSVVEQCKEQNVPVWLKQARAWDEGWTRTVARGIGVGPGAIVKKKPGGDRVIELPYLDQVQHKELPRCAKS